MADVSTLVSSAAPGTIMKPKSHGEPVTDPGEARPERARPGLLKRVIIKIKKAWRWVLRSIGEPESDPGEA